MIEIVMKKFDSYSFILWSVIVSAWWNISKRYEVRKSVIKKKIDFQDLWLKGIQTSLSSPRDIIVEVYCSPSLSLSLLWSLASLNLSYHILNFFIFQVYSKHQNTFS